MFFSSPSFLFFLSTILVFHTRGTVCDYVTLDGFYPGSTLISYCRQIDLRSNLGQITNVEVKVFHTKRRQGFDFPSIWLDLNKSMWHQFEVNLTWMCYQGNICLSTVYPRINKLLLKIINNCHIKNKLIKACVCKCLLLISIWV